MKNDEKVPFTDFGDSLSRYMIRNSSWVYLFIIIILLFGIVYGWGIVNQEPENSTSEELELYKNEITVLKEKIELQENRIEMLESSVKQLQSGQ